MFRKFPAFAALSALLFVACGSQQTKPVQVLSGTREAAEFALTSLKGTRDGERVAVQAVYGGGSQTLTVHLHFKLLPQAKLERGTWAGPAGQGRVQERSVTFFGQSGPPSIGGRFDLIGSGDQPLYRVSVSLCSLRRTHSDRQHRRRSEPCKVAGQCIPRWGHLFEARRLSELTYWDAV